MMPQVSMQRSTFKTPKNIRTTFNTGLLIPFYVNQNVYPGETYKFNMATVIRQSTPIHPTMDNAYADIYFFYDRKRNLWQHWNEFMGENTTGAWSYTGTEYTEPQIRFLRAGSSTIRAIKKGDIAHYMGLPLTNNSSDFDIKVSRLPFTSYIRIWNNFFRNQNLEAPAWEPSGDADINAMLEINRPTNENWHAANITTAQVIQPRPAPVNKFADYFTTCNPAPQKGSPITLPIGQSAPLSIYGNGKGLGISDGTNNKVMKTSTDYKYLAMSSLDAPQDIGTTSSADGGIKDRIIGITTDPDKSGLTGFADLSNAVAATINAQRIAFASQRILERDTFGTRIWEVVRNHFQTIVDEKVIGIPEYLGGFRLPLNITEIPQTSSTDSTTPQGNLAGYGHTVSSRPLFTKSFTEWGIIIGLICIRTKHSYSQGIERQWSRKRRLDYYWPELSHIGEQPVYNKEIFATGTAQDEQVFGYQEAWADLKYERDINTGAFDPNYAQTLASWHYGDKYNSLPVLSGDWSNETKDYVDRTLAVTSAIEDQWLMDCHLDITKTSPMPMYSLPGLIDHF